MKWLCEIEWLDDHVRDFDERLIVTFGEDIDDDEVFYYVQDEDELERLTVPKNCVDFLIIGYKKI